MYRIFVVESVVTVKGILVLRRMQFSLNVGSCSSQKHLQISRSERIPGNLNDYERHLIGEVFTVEGITCVTLTLYDIVIEVGLAFDADPIIQCLIILILGLTWIVTM